MNVEIYEAEFEGGDLAFAADFPVAPYGQAQLGAQDNSEASRQLLQDLADHWMSLWPKMRDYLNQGISRYRLNLKLAECEWIATVGHIEEDCFIAEEAKIHLRWDFETIPVWDFFIRGSHIAHFQPVF